MGKYIVAIIVNWGSAGFLVYLYFQVRQRGEEQTAFWLFGWLFGVFLFIEGLKNVWWAIRERRKKV